VLHWIGLEQGIRRFYSLMIELGPSGPCAWCATGCGAAEGQEPVEVFADEIKAIVSAIFSKQKGPGQPGPRQLPSLLLLKFSVPTRLAGMPGPVRTTVSLSSSRQPSRGCRRIHERST
jgi:hypothetical protein